MSCHGNSYAVQNWLVWTFLDHIRTGQGNTGRICLLTIVWYVLSASERGIFKERKTFKSGKKKKERRSLLLAWNVWTLLSTAIFSSWASFSAGEGCWEKSPFQCHSEDSIASQECFLALLFKNCTHSLLYFPAFCIWWANKLPIFSYLRK